MSTKITVGGAVLWEREVAPPPLDVVNLPVRMSNHAHQTKAARKLTDLPPTMRCEVVEPPALPRGAQEITVEFQRTLFTFSPRGRAYVSEGGVRFRGYLSLVSEGRDADGAPTAEVSITPVNSEELVAR